MQYQIQDSAHNTAVVEVTRNIFFGDEVEWQSLTEGAFRPDLPLNKTLTASTYGPMVMCHWNTVAGRMISCFSMLNYYLAYTRFAHDEGKGNLFADGVSLGKLQPGPMTWKKI